MFFFIFLKRGRAGKLLLRHRIWLKLSTPTHPSTHPNPPIYPSVFGASPLPVVRIVPAKVESKLGGNVVVAKSSRMHVGRRTRRKRGAWWFVGWRVSVRWGAVRAQSRLVPRRTPSASRHPTLLVLVCSAPLRAPHHSCSEHDSRRPIVTATRDLCSTVPITFRGSSATCGV